MKDEDFARMEKEGYDAGYRDDEPGSNPYEGKQGDYYWRRGWVVGKISLNMGIGKPEDRSDSGNEP